MVFRAFCVGTHARKPPIHLVFLSLIRTFDLKVQGTHVRESKKKFGISFWILLT